MIWTLVIFLILMGVLFEVRVQANHRRGCRT